MTFVKDIALKVVFKKNFTFYSVFLIIFYNTICLPEELISLYLSECVSAY